MIYPKYIIINVIHVLNDAHYLLIYVQSLLNFFHSNKSYMIKNSLMMLVRVQNLHLFLYFCQVI